MNEETKVCENILFYRQKQGITQKALAAKLDISFKTLSSWEVGRNRPDIGYVPDICKALGGRATTFIGVSGSAAEHEIAFTHRVLGCNGLYNSFSLGPKITFDTMPFGFENHLIFGSINFRQDHMEKAIRMLAASPYDQIVELIDRDEFAADPIGAYENRIYCKNAPMKTAVIWDRSRINMEG